MRGLKFFGFAALATCAALVFLAALDWNAGALNQPLSDASIIGILSAMLIWFIRVGSLGWILIGGTNYFLRYGLPWPRSASSRGSPRDTESRSGCGHSQGFGCGRQSKMKRCAPSVVRRGPQTATMGLDNGTADG
jgi:hypothetical protein